MSSDIRLPSAEDDDVICPGRYCFPLNACMTLVKIPPRWRKFVVRWYLYVSQDMVPMAIAGAAAASIWGISMGSLAVLVPNRTYTLWARCTNMGGALFAAVVWPTVLLAYTWQFGPRGDINHHIGVGYLRVVAR